MAQAASLPPATRSYESVKYGLNSARGTAGKPSAFTLIELILVMAILTIAVGYTAPALARFFRGRSLDAEARRLLALTREARSRAAYEGIPMDVWIDTGRGAYGMEAEPGYAPDDVRSVELNVESDLRLEIGREAADLSFLAREAGDMLPMPEPAATSTSATLRTKHAGLPRIRFLPNGSIDATSPVTLRIVGRDESALVLAQTRNRRNYEIRSGQ